MKCIYCGVSYSYYNSPEHAARKSCRHSKSGYHDFIDVLPYYFELILETLTCKKKPINFKE